jgi:hypothetical protein
MNCFDKENMKYLLMFEFMFLLITFPVHLLTKLQRETKYYDRNPKSFEKGILIP